MNLVDLRHQATEYLAKDLFGEVIALYEQAINADSADSKVVTNYWYLGLALLLQGEESEAQAIWLSAITQGAPEQIDTWTSDLIQVLEIEAVQRLQSNRSQQAEKIYCQILELDPENVKAYLNLGTACVQQNKLEQGLSCYYQALALDPSDAEVCRALGVAFEKQNKLEEAVNCYQRSLALNPSDAEVYNNLGLIFEAQNKMNEAVICHYKAIQVDSDFIFSHNNMGGVLEAQGNLEEAANWYRKATAINPDYAVAHTNLGRILEAQEQLDEAIVCYYKAIEVNPDYVNAYHNLGFAFEKQGKFAESLSYYSQALELNPNYAIAHFNHALMLLRMGDFEHGWVEYEWRWQRDEVPPCPLEQPLWNGSNLESQTILIYTEQGLGDTIQFIRYIPLVAQCGGRVIVTCQASLARLLETVAGIDQLIPMGVTLPHFDVHTPLLSLPRLLKTTLKTVPVQIPYLAAPEVYNINLKTPPKTRLKVGIAWAGNPKNLIDYRRSCTLADFTQLLQIPNIAFYSLQKEPRAVDLAQLVSMRKVVQDLSHLLNDFADTAVVVEQLDLVITVDTSVAHLAGALGHPVWVLLPFVPDWRWMIEREDSPWYPTMRLFRQTSPGDWAGVMNRVAEALQASNPLSHLAQAVQSSAGG